MTQDQARELTDDQIRDLICHFDRESPESHVALALRELQEVRKEIIRLHEVIGLHERHEQAQMEGRRQSWETLRKLMEMGRA